ncbi:MAG: hypothetical protein DMF59_07205 [Acidobacteria bacterium]|nr:MAG: hypothetical protein DMF59_07205 [Acidobacteriota bacterium]
MGILFLVVLFGCKKNEPAPTSTVSTETTATTATVAPTPQPTATTATTATVTSAAPTTGVVASTDGETSGTHIDVTEFKRASGNTVSLKFVLTNSGSDSFAMYGHKLGDHDMRHDYKSVGGIHLVDPVNKKKYFVVRDSEQKCICSNEVADVKPGEKVNLWAKFPAPPPDVTKVTIEVPHFQPMDDVPISQ